MTVILTRIQPAESGTPVPSKQPSEDMCPCASCPCRTTASRPSRRTDDSVPPGYIVFQLPKYREPVSDTYSHSVYKKEYCNKALIKQLKNMAQKKVLHYPKDQPRVEPERFACKTLTETDYRRYNLRETALCKAKFPKMKRKEDFYYKRGEYTCGIPLPKTSISHQEYSPKNRIPSFSAKNEKDFDIPPFEGMSCYRRDFEVPNPCVYPKRKALKRTKFN